MARFIFPTDLSKGTVNGAPANVPTEKNWIEYHKRRGRSALDSFVSSGMTLSAGGGLSCNVAAGNAIVEAYWIGNTTTENVAGLTANRTIATPNFIYSQLQKNGGGQVTDWVVVASTSPPSITDAVMLGVAVTDASSVTSVQNVEVSPHIVVGSYTGDALATRYFYVGFQPRQVQIFSTDWDNLTGGNQTILSLSGNAAGSGVPGILLPAGTSVTSINSRAELFTWGFTIGNGNQATLNAPSQTFRYTIFA